jgi:hypothetical protein
MNNYDTTGNQIGEPPEDEEAKWIKRIVNIAALVLLGAILWGSFVSPILTVWSRGLDGEAQLREAEWNKQIAIEEARAEKDSATLKKEADIIRAEGIAEANKIIASSLTEEYIRWKWVEGLQGENIETIYVPTEAGIPIMEAMRGK